ncbi:MAG: aspartate carbamoyltransferase [Propionibacteriales bacterium]|nr:aspartate carbamoyltransferase [Propionibacteriales bacterium]
MRIGTKVLALSASVLLGASGVTACTSDDGGDADHRQHQEEVAQRGSEVMPFDLDATTHIFDKNSEGVVERVAADDPQDGTQIRLVREHLTKEEARFEGGDFSDPTAVHGEAMPGVKELSEGASEIDVEYVEIPNGAELIFTTTDRTLVRALHAWTDAQVYDHGDHASHG